MCIVNSFVEISTLKNNELPLIGYLNDDLVLSKNHNLSECSSIFFCIKRLDAIVMAFRMGKKQFPFMQRPSWHGWIDHIDCAVDYNYRNKWCHACVSGSLDIEIFYEYFII